MSPANWGEVRGIEGSVDMPVTVCVSERDSSNSSACRLLVCVCVCMFAHWELTWYRLREPVMVVFPFEYLLCGWRQKVSGWPCFPSAMRLVPSTVAQLPSHFAIIILVGICVRPVRKLKKQGQATHFILKLHKLTCTLIPSMHWNWSVEGHWVLYCPVQSLK